MENCRASDPPLPKAHVQWPLDFPRTCFPEGWQIPFRAAAALCSATLDHLYLEQMVRLIPWERRLKPSILNRMMRFLQNVGMQRVVASAKPAGVLGASCEETALEIVG